MLPVKGRAKKDASNLSTSDLCKIRLVLQTTAAENFRSTLNPWVDRKKERAGREKDVIWCVTCTSGVSPMDELTLTNLWQYRSSQSSFDLGPPRTFWNVLCGCQVWHLIITIFCFYLFLFNEYEKMTLDYYHILFLHFSIQWIWEDDVWHKTRFSCNSLDSRACRIWIRVTT